MHFKLAFLALIAVLGLAACATPAPIKAVVPPITTPATLPVTIPTGTQQTLPVTIPTGTQQTTTTLPPITSPTRPPDGTNYVKISCGLADSATSSKITHNGYFDATLNMSDMNISLYIKTKPTQVSRVNSSDDATVLALRNANVGQTVVFSWYTVISGFQFTYPATNAVNGPEVFTLTVNGYSTIGGGASNAVLSHFASVSATSYVNPSGGGATLGGTPFSTTRFYGSEVTTGDLFKLDQSLIGPNQNVPTSLGHTFTGQGTYINGGISTAGDFRGAAFDTEGNGCASLSHML